MSALSFILTNGVSYGLILALISMGLVITLGLMHVVNLAHGAFAAIGGYLVSSLMLRHGFDYPVAIVVGTVSVALASIGIERLIFVALYKAPELEQVIVTLGLNYIAIGSLTLFFGTDVYPTPLPAYLTHTVELGGRPFEMYRIMVVGVGLLVVLALWLLFDCTKIGARLRAAVDNPSMASVSGINVPRLFAGTFALGCGLAALGGSLGAPMLPLEPSWPLKYLVPILIVVALTGHGNIRAVVGVSILVGIIDTAGRYLLPAFGAFPMYVTCIVLLIWRKDGVFARKKT